jgi:formate hydrogenlyase transcriptional activator
MLASLITETGVTETESDQSTAARYESLIRIAAAVRSQKAPEELFGLLIEELGQVVRFDAIAQFDESSNKIHWHMCPGCRRPASLPGEAEETLPAWVYRNQETVALTSLDYETRFPASISLMRQAGLQSVCAFPLSTAHRRLGSLVIASVHRNAYSPEEVRFCALVANQIALAMDDAINFQASQRAQERLELLLDLTNRVVSNLNLRDVLREISANIRRVMQCDGVGIHLPSPEDKKLRLYALDFPDNPGIIQEGFEPPAGEKASALRVFTSGEPSILSKGEIEHEPMPAGAEMIRSLAHVPLTGRAAIVGVLTLGSWRDHAFSQDDVAFLGQIARQVAIAIENAWAFGEVSDIKDKLAQEKLYLEGEIRSELKFEEIVGKSQALRAVLEQVETVAPTDSTVLIYGETGTGKELIARAVHNLSSRQSNGFVKLNCAAIPTGLLESELFGHERGAFTGAISQRVGRFELANRGTMFLDEIGEVPLELQPKLLRVLQEREFERLGSTRTLRTDARLIAATNRDLEALVSEQKFRSDLYYRLNVFPVRVPALRERPEDIPLLVRHFVQQFSRRMGKGIDTIPSETMTTLIKYSWPGNIRELQNVIERAVILTKGPILNIPSDDLRVTKPNAIAAAAAAQNPPASPSEGRGNMRAVLDDTERKQIVEALEQTNWTVAGPNGAAVRLGMKRSTLQSRMNKLGIRISRAGA